MTDQSQGVIKFRAWDLNNQCWYQRIQDREHYQELLVADNGRAVLYEYYPGDDGGNLIDTSAFEIVRYTNLKDKNGVDVYEGDIVMCLGGEPCKVYWTEGAWAIKPDIRWNQEENTRVAQYLGEFFAKDIEVIGNIYENPKLLK